MNYLDYEQIDAYKKAFRLGNVIWNDVLSWEKFARWTIGKQYVNSADSISANLAEGWGRYFKKEKIQFFRYSYGSLKECQDWTNKAQIRGLLTPGNQKEIQKLLLELPKDINQLIQYTNQKLKY